MIKTSKQKNSWGRYRGIKLTVNINEEVEVKLTEEGKRIVEESGYHIYDRCQLWQLFEIFGTYIRHGMPKPVFKNNEITFHVCGDEG